MYVNYVCSFVCLFVTFILHESRVNNFKFFQDGRHLYDLLVAALRFHCLHGGLMASFMDSSMPVSCVSVVLMSLRSHLLLICDRC